MNKNRYDMGARSAIMPAAITPFQARREERNRNIREEFKQLMAENPERSKMMVKDYLKEKYNVSSDDAYYKILKG